MITGMMAGYYAVTTWVPTYLKTVRGLSVLNTGVARGSWLNAGTATEPVAVLGSAAAQRLGIAVSSLYRKLEEYGIQR